MVGSSEKLDLRRREALWVGIPGLALSAVGVVLWPQPFLRSYLVTYLFLFGIGIGALGLLMIHQLTGGRWGEAIGGLLESASRTLPLLGLLFVPIALGVGKIYAWTSPTPNGEPLGHTALYLNVPMFLLRAAVYFACWLGLVFLLTRWARQRRTSDDPALAGRMRTLSGPGLVLCILTLTFASFDWLMSLQPHWYSTMFSFIFVAGHGLTAMAFVVLAVALAARQVPASDMLRMKTLVDLGNLLLLFVMFWAYVSFSQFLLIWMGNLPEEIDWYVTRFDGGWKWIALALVVLQFAVPFLLLLSRDVKRDPGRLAAVAGLVLAMRLPALFWDVVPAYDPKGLLPHWPELATFVLTLLGAGGVWLAVFLSQVSKLPSPAIGGAAAEEASENE